VGSGRKTPPPTLKTVGWEAYPLTHTHTFVELPTPQYDKAWTDKIYITETSELTIKYYKHKYAQSTEKSSLPSLFLSKDWR